MLLLLLMLMLLLLLLPTRQRLLRSLPTLPCVAQRRGLQRGAARQL